MLYEKAVDEMLIRTSTTYAPWILVEADCKYYARIKVLRTVVEAIEKRLKEEKRTEIITTWFVFLTTYSKGIYRKMCLCIMSDIHHGRYLAQHCFCP